MSGTLLTCIYKYSAAKRYLYLKLFSNFATVDHLKIIRSNQLYLAFYTVHGNHVDTPKQAEIEFESYPTNMVE